MAEISAQDTFDLAPPRKDCTPEFFQVRATLAERGRSVPQKSCALAGEDLGERRFGFDAGDGIHGSPPMLTVATFAFDIGREVGNVNILFADNFVRQHAGHHRSPLSPWRSKARSYRNRHGYAARGQGLAVHSKGSGTPGRRQPRRPL